MAEIELATAEKVVSEWWDSCAADARTAGLTWEWDALSPLMTAIHNAVLDEREACAKVADKHRQEINSSADYAAECIARAIRKRMSD